MKFDVWVLIHILFDRVWLFVSIETRHNDEIGFFLKELLCKTLQPIFVVSVIPYKSIFLDDKFHDSTLTTIGWSRILLLSLHV